MKPLKLIALVLALAGPARAYVTSATFEYSVDDRARLYLNGHLVVADTGIHYPDYAVLSTSDGSLPMEYFALNGENVLAVENIDTTGGVMGISYRLTVHHSSGDPVVIWSLPEDSKIMHLSKDGKEPEGWFKPGYDDRAWPNAVSIVYGTTWYTYPEIPDPAFSSFIGMKGVVPHIAHIGNGASSPGDRNLFRNRFRFPYNPAKVRLTANATSANRGQKLAFRLMPGGDVADIGAFKLYADLPLGLDLVSAPGAAVYDRDKRRVGWSYLSAASGLRYLTLTAQSVISAGGWLLPQKVLGGFKPDHPTGSLHPGIPDDRYFDSAAFFPGMDAWFKMQAPDPATAAGYPEILGVIFHSQLLAAGQNTAKVNEVDDFRINYSVSPGTQKALKKDVWVGRASNANSWFDGYYDATKDRRWTWNDLNNLKFFITANTRRSPDKNRMASVWAVVKCFRPQDSSPVFYAQVTEAGCKKLEVQAGLYSSRFALASSDPLGFPVNQGACPRPTPVPTVAVVVTAPGRPTPTPVPKGPKPGLEYLGLGQLSSSPQPFGYGGVFVKFSLKRPAEVTLRVFGMDSKLLREVTGGQFRPGESQIFFNAMDSGEKPLKPGPYFYQLTATDGEYKAMQQANFTRGPDKRR